MTVVEFHLPGPPRTRREPRIGINRATGRPMSFPDPKTKADHADWVRVWRRASAGLKIEGPVCVEVYVRLRRPASHLKRDGALTSEGKRHRYPPSFDLDNVCKCLLDALKHQAFEDDAHVVALHSTKRYVSASSEFLAGTSVAIRSIERD